jgi:hypothetical protein
MPIATSPGRVSHALPAIAQQSAARVVCAAWLVLTSASALDAQSSRSAPATAVALQRCMDTAATAAPARLDAEHVIYVEQETVVAQRDDRVLVAGNPVFVWRDRGDRYDLLGLDSLFGMIIEPSLSVHAIPKPMNGRSFDGMRAAALTDGWWLVTFAEVIPAQPPKTPTVVAMWTGETDGTRWRSLQELPMVADSIETWGMSLAWRDGRARLAVPFMHDGRRLVVLYAFDEGRWSARIDTLGFLSYVAIALAPSRDLMAVVRPLETVDSDNNSLFLYTKSPRDSTWINTAHIVRGRDDPVRDPLFSGENPRVLSWRRETATSRSTEAWFATVSENGDSISTPTQLATGATLTSLASRSGHAILAIADRVWPNPTLQFVELGEPSPIAKQRMHTNYRGLIGVELTHAKVVLIAARAATTPRDPAVVSILQTHAWRCQ